MTEPGCIRYETDTQPLPKMTAAVQLVLSRDWAMVLHRQQQLLNRYAEGVHLHIFRDEHGLVRIPLDD